MAAPQGIDVSKLSPAEKEQMMQQVFANATTVRRSRAQTRETRPPPGARSRHGRRRPIAPHAPPASPALTLRRRWSIASSCSTSASSRPRGTKPPAERLPDAFSPARTDRPRDALTPSPPPPLRRRMVGSCYDKCIDKKFKDGDLNVGENSCVDRCTAKYWQSVGIVGQMLGAADAQAAQTGR